MSQLTYNPHNPRAQKARLAAMLDNKPLRWLLWLVLWAGLGGWIWGVFLQHQMLAHLLLALASLPIMLLFWYYGELRKLPPTEAIDQATDVSSILSRRLLAKMKPKATPIDLAKIVEKEQGGMFYAARFGIGPAFLQQLSSNDATQTAVVWEKAVFIAKSLGNNRINSAVLVAALVYALPDSDGALAPFQLDGEDVLSGVSWFDHLRSMIARHRQKRHSGGIGRDLSYGWAPLLNHVAFNITDSLGSGGLLRRSVDSRKPTIDQIIHLLAQPGRRNATLVGEVGSGKTTLVYAMAQQLLFNPKDVPDSLRYQQVLTLDASHLIANAQQPGQLEELLIHIFNEAIHAKNVIIFLDEAQLFFREGTGSVDLSSLLMPVLQGGALKMILAFDDQDWLRLSQTNPGLAQQLNRVVVAPLGLDETVQVIEDETLVLEGKHGVVIMNQAIKEAYKLAERFIHEQAFPGKALKLLEAAAGFPEQKHFITAKSVQQAVERSFNVKVQTADTQAERDTLLNLEEKIHQRMINQSRAVKLVSDSLRRARAGVRNEAKPIGTFLFLGPTGVGKTELSKALADVYFGGEEHMVRVDLNEFSHPDDTNRLLATGAADPYSLCAQITKQPFSVVLLDEIEKAHPNVLNLLLQMLDEGQLRDTQNKPVSFRDAIIIATSNAGADRIRAHIDQGQQLEQFEQQFVDEMISANEFRPEFLNRFDEIVLFRPLTKEELMQVVDLLVAGLNKTLASRKVSVTLTQAAKSLMVDKGYDPRLGARPLRRTVQRAVENVVAQQLLGGDIAPGASLELDAPELQASLDARQ
jgi:ATP-dependent Clp protease ATP-binding subunit ClpC